MSIAELAPNLWRLRANIVACYLLRDAEGFGLIDSGWIGSRALIGRALRAQGADWSALDLLLLTHGHIDHVGNAAWLQERSPALCARVHAADLDHACGRHVYRGLSRVCGWLETVARPLTGFRAPRLAQPLAEGEVIERFGGLEVVHLPGHTAGHCGLIHRATGWLFCGDLFSTTLGIFHWPPPFLNSAAAAFPATHARAAALPVSGFLPAHCDNANPARQRERFLLRC